MKIAAAGLCLLSCSPPEPVYIRGQADPCSTGSAAVGNGINLSPKLIWKKDLKDSVDPDPGISLGAILLPLPENKLRIVSANNGSQYAEIRFREPIINSIVTADTLTVLNTGGKRLLVLNWLNKEVLWEAELEGSSVNPSVYKNRLLWIDGLRYLRCFDIFEGKRIWDRKLNNVDFTVSEVCSLGVAIFADNGLIECFDLERGERKWSFDAGARIKGDPVIFEDQLFFSTIDGMVARIEMRNGELVWMTDLRSPVFGGLACDGSGIYLGTNNRFMIRLDYDSGDIDWKLEAGGPIKTNPVLIDRFVVFVGLDHKAYFIDKASGKIILAYETDGMITVRPVVCGNRVFIASEDNNLYCFQLTGEESSGF